jgi:diaminohydroxyphosphoribosylaminopyrimidine deaminase/5-amino-6-(5-phosphoribosylamino)uracil reductase
MRRALELAQRGEGSVEPNPMVGAVVVRDEVVVGEGWHQRYGGPHAEVFALREAGERARGATLYVTLEPCCHHGKTPPCTDAVLRAGIARVVAAQADPYPEVAGRGAETLRAAGIEVEVGVCEAEARAVNAPYRKLLARGQPWVHAKWAMTLDGRIATRTGDSRWISNEVSRARVHSLRGRMDAIVVGMGTVLADDPQLTARPPGPRTALRVVLDSQGRLPVGCNLVKTAREVPTLVATTALMAGERRRELEALGCEVVEFPAEQNRVVLDAVLAELGRRRATNLLVEGGGIVLGGFRDAGAIDEVHVFVAPRIVGGAGAAAPVLGVGVERIAEALTLAEHRVEVLEGDVYIRGRVGRPEAAE